LTTLYFAYSSAITLVDLIAISPSVAHTFSQACRVFHEASEDYPLSNLLLEGLAAVARRLSVQVPETTAPYFSNLNVARPKHELIPLGFVVPVHTGRTELLVDGELEFVPEEGGIELGDLLARLNANT
jgi:hypothetical protein